MAIPTRNVDNLRNKMKVTDLAREGQSHLTDLSGNSEVLIEWHLNETADKDKIFRITINGEEAIIDLEELMFVQRIMF